MITRPLLAETVESPEQVKFPVYATPKLDGIRCIKVNGQVLTRKFKPLPNDHIRNILEKILPDGMDGEIMLRSALPEGKTIFDDIDDSEFGRRPTFNDIQSAVMKKAGTPDFVFHAFDYVKDDLNKPYKQRVGDMIEWYQRNQTIALPYIDILLPTPVYNTDDLAKLENTFIANGFEGVMIRHPEGKYKCGRSTLKEGILLKIKQFVDSEAVVLDFEERLHNTNEQETNELGLAKRSTKKEGMVGANTLGNFKVRDITTGLEFHIGSGMDDKLRKEVWENREAYRNAIIKYKYQPIGAKELPRFPVFLGFRHADDMGEPSNDA